MWADTLLAAERGHIVRLMAWGAASIVGATLVFLLLAAGRSRSPLLKHFAIQTAAWGAVDIAIAAWAWYGLELRDLSGYVRLDRLLWLNVGLSGGYVGVGVTLAAAGWTLGRRFALVGAGLGVIVQGLALMILDLMLALQLARFVR